MNLEGACSSGEFLCKCMKVSREGNLTTLLKVYLS